MKLRLSSQLRAPSVCMDDPRKIGKTGKNNKIEKSVRNEALLLLKIIESDNLKLGW
jgi:hypothetical protein